MFKSLIILSILLNLTSSRSLSNEDVCEVEMNRWVQCFQASFSFNVTANPAQDNQELLSTVAPTNPGLDAIKNLRKLLSCIGDLECNGWRKAVKFQLETFVFSFDELQSADNCVKGTDLEKELDQCITYKTPDYLDKKEYNGEILKCTQKIIEELECSEEETEAIWRAALAQHDLMDMMVNRKSDDELVNFDKEFDPTKYY